MKVEGQHFRTIWRKKDDPSVVQIIDQRHLPHRFVIEDLRTVDEVVVAISEMHVRGAGLIGAAAGYGMYLGGLTSPRSSDDAFLEAMDSSARRLKESRPTAVNLEWAVNRQVGVLNRVLGIDGMIHALRQTADRIADEDSEYCRRIGEHGLRIIEEIRSKKGGERVNILTHCNAGWLAFVDYKTATAPIYEAHDAGIRVHVSGRRDATPESGRGPDGLGTGPTRRPSHRDRRQCRRPPDAAWTGGHGHRERIEPCIRAT